MDDGGPGQGQVEIKDSPQHDNINPLSLEKGHTGTGKGSLVFVVKKL
jgi:hypothetical protein